MVVAMIHRTDGRTDVAMAVGPMVALAMPVLSYREDEVSQQEKNWQLVGFFFLASISVELFRAASNEILSSICIVPAWDFLPTPWRN